MNLAFKAGDPLNSIFWLVFSAVWIRSELQCGFLTFVPVCDFAVEKWSNAIGCRYLFVFWGL